MLSAFHSLFFQRLSPFIANTLNIINALILVLSALLLLFALSIGNAHNKVESGHFLAQESAQAVIDNKLLADNRLWFIESNLGGGIIVTDSARQIKNKVSARHYAIFLTFQNILVSLLIIAAFTSLVLLVSKHYLNLVIATALLIFIIYQLQTYTLFYRSIDISAPISQHLYWLSLLALIYWGLNKRLLKNNHISDTLIAYASQSGSAMSLAKRFSKALSHTSDVRCFSTLTPKVLSQYNEVLFIASTYGEGQPPEKAHRFMDKLSNHKHYSASVRYSILALGDRHYPQFCAFGHQLAQVLNSKGAKPLLGLVEVDKLDTATINAWWHKLTQKLNWHAGDIQQNFSALPVTSNTCCNPSQTLRHAHTIQFDKGQIDYQPGDLLEVLPKRSTEQCRKLILNLGLNAQEIVIIDGQSSTLEQALSGLEWQDEIDEIGEIAKIGEVANNAQALVDKLPPLSPRVYSIASSPYQEQLEIFVRRYKRPDGCDGVASNYLCDLADGELVMASRRIHSNFHLPQHDAPLILIGAGTGIAPLIGFLRHRSASGSSQQHWLFFGEQYQDSDYYFAKDIKAFQAQGLITKLSLAWSRDSESSYIGEHIKQQQTQLRHWVHELGAYIYVCGSRTGFGDSVSEQLTDLFGQAELERMIQAGKLRTDLY